MQVSRRGSKPRWISRLFSAWLTAITASPTRINALCLIEGIMHGRGQPRAAEPGGDEAEQGARDHVSVDHVRPEAPAESDELDEVANHGELTATVA